MPASFRRPWELILYPAMTERSRPTVQTRGCVWAAAAPLPAADDGLAGQGQVQEGLPQLEGQRVLERLTVNDQRQLVLLLQGVAQGGAVLRQLGPGRLRGLDQIRWISGSHSGEMALLCSGEDK